MRHNDVTAEWAGGTLRQSVGALGFRTGAVAFAAAWLVTLGGCDCDRSKDQMDRTANEGYAQAWACCHAIRELDPPAAIACFEDLKEWRTELTALIVRWYQACLDGNQSLADQILRTMHRIFVEGPGGSGLPCGTIVVDGGGQPRTVGLAIAGRDRIVLGGDLKPLPRRFGGAGDGMPPPQTGRDLAIDGWATVEIAEMSFDLVLSGRVGLAIPGPLASQIPLGHGGWPETVPVDDIELLLSAPGGSILRLSLEPEIGSPALLRVGTAAVLRAACRVEAEGPLRLLLPETVWLELPLIPRANPADGFELAGDRRPLRSVLPPALGFADFDRNGVIDERDLLAFRSAPADAADLDLDGDVDADDDRLFLASWRFAID
jgi:hypothetical protein